MKTFLAIYLLVFATACCILGFQVHAKGFGAIPDGLDLPACCAFMGGIGGCTYCLRGIYVNACVHKRWDATWHPWYLIRPWVSLICGGVSYVFLKTGLVLLESSQEAGSTNLGFYALSFIAGFNVDNFLSKIEDIAHATWGIKKSRAGNPEEK